MKIYGRAPVRISLCNGGDTDYYINAMGWGNLINATLSTHGYFCIVEPKKQKTITYTYINKFYNRELQVDINNIEKDNGENLKLITSTIKAINPLFKGKIKVITNVPEKSGLGGSSSLVVALIKALIKTTGEKNITPEKIAQLAYHIERKVIGIKGGYQDQWAAAFGGGVNYLEFNKKNIFLEPLWLHEKLMKNLEKNLVLFFLEHRKEDGGNLHKELEKNLKKKKKETLDIMLKKRENVSKTREALLKGDIKAFAKLLNEEQRNKERLMEKVSTWKAKTVYDIALHNGAIAGKISGVGSGGCAFFLYQKKDKRKFIEIMSYLNCVHIPLKLERLNSMGII